MSGVASGEMRKLPVWTTIIAAYGFLFRNWREALRIAWLPVVAVVGLGLLRQYLPSGEGWPTIALALYGLAIWAAYAPIVAMAVVPWHRYILLNQRARGGVFAVVLSVREGRYVALSVAIMAIATGMQWAGLLVPFFFDWISTPGSIVRVLLSTPGFLFYLAVVAASFYLFAMLTLALPAVAADRDGSLRGALHRGHRNGWRLVLVNLAAAAPYYAHYYGSYYGSEFLPDSAFEGFWNFAWHLIYAVMLVFEIFIFATALSLCYRALGGLRGSEQRSTVIPPSGNA